MNDFLEKWKTDSKFKAKVQLGIYGGFMLIAVIFAFAARSNANYNNETFFNSNQEENEKSISIPEKYKYSINIDLNEKNYKYTGIKNKDQETITKTKDDKIYKYIKKKDTYYQNSVVINNITEKEEVYDIIDYNYLNLETINQYLSKSIEEEDRYIVYLKDIILGNDSDNYITIKKDKNKININYTALINLFNKDIEDLNVEIIIEEIK